MNDEVYSYQESKLSIFAELLRSNCHCFSKLFSRITLPQLDCSKLSLFIALTLSPIFAQVSRIRIGPRGEVRKPLKNQGLWRAISNSNCQYGNQTGADYRGRDIGRK